MSKLRFSYRSVMTVLLAVLVALVPVGVLLMRTVPTEGEEAKRLWLRWAGVYLLALFGLLIALVWVVLKDIRRSLEQFRKAHRQAFEEMTEQIRADYERKRQRFQPRNGSDKKHS